MKKVLFVCSTLNLGGVAKMVSFITTNLPDDYEIDILLNSDEDIQFPYRGNIISLDVPEPKDRVSVSYQAKVFFKRLKVLRKIKKQNRYDAVISLLDSANIANCISGKKHTKTVYTCVNVLSEEDTFQYRYIVCPLVRLTYNRADAIIAQTNVIRQDLVERYHIKDEIIHIIPNAIDVDTVNSLSKEKCDDGFFNKEKTFITAGRMEYQKAQWHLLRAFSYVHDKEPEAKLAIFGIGTLEDYLKALISELGLMDVVSLKGFDNELDKYVGHSLAYVFPSMYEGMPTALIQAMACEVPCLVSDFRSGAREIIGGRSVGEEDISQIVLADYGIMTPVCSGKRYSSKDPLEEKEILLAEAMLKLYRDANLRKEYAQRAYNRSLDYDIKNVIIDWEKIIES